MPLYIVIYLYSTGVHPDKETDCDWLKYRLLRLQIRRSEERTQLLLNFESGCCQGTGEKWTDETIVACHIQNTYYLPCERVPDRRCRAGEVLPAIAIMLCCHELHDMTVGESRTNSIRTSPRFAPVTAWNEVDVSKTTAYPRIANHVQ